MQQHFLACLNVPPAPLTQSPSPSSQTLQSEHLLLSGNHTTNADPYNHEGNDSSGDPPFRRAALVSVSFSVPPP